jgi:hypothetical protein
LSDLVRFWIYGWDKNHLSNPVPIPKINENQFSVIPTSVHPAAEGDLLIFVLFAELSTGVSS